MTYQADRDMSGATRETATRARGRPGPTASLGQWLVASAQAAASAAKEGGFMGFGAAQVSKGEREMLDQVRAAVSRA